jgi:hypothetical protein
MTSFLSKRNLELALICIGILLFGYYMLGIYYVRTFKLRFTPTTPAEQARMDELSKNLDNLSQGIRNGTVPWRKIDRSSVGFPEKEAKLLMLRSEVDFFTVKFGHHPSQIGDLTRLDDLPDFCANHAKVIKSLRNKCEIVNLEPDSYILGCDAFSSLSPTVKDELLKSFDRGNEKFYDAQGHVILYDPPPITGRPPTSGTSNPNH